MDDAGGMCGAQRIGNLQDRARGVEVRQRTARETLGERLPFVVRHRDERLPVRVADLIDGGDVRMIERAGGARLAQEPRRGFGMRYRLRGQETSAPPSGGATDLRRGKRSPFRRRRVHR